MINKAKNIIYKIKRLMLSFRNKMMFLYVINKKNKNISKYICFNKYRLNKKKCCKRL